MTAVARERVRRLCAAGGAERQVRAAVLRAVRDAVAFDHYVWVGTDPVTAVGAAPLAEVPALPDLPRVVRLKYSTVANRWTGLPGNRVATFADADDADGPWRALLASYGVADVASAVLRDRFGIWGFLDLWRCASPFTAAETGFLAGLLPGLTAAARAAVAATFVPATAPADAGPAVLLLSEGLVPGERTPHTDTQLRALLPTPADLQPVPAVALNVAAQLLAVEGGVDDRPPSARLAQAPGRWVTARAARLRPGNAIAVTIERSTTAERAEVYARAIGLTPRETEVVGQLVTGVDTRGAARALGIADHTVNDHLKSVFAKAGTVSRRQLVANVTG